MGLKALRALGHHFWADFQIFNKEIRRFPLYLLFLAHRLAFGSLLLRTEEAHPFAALNSVLIIAVTIRKKCRH